MSVPKLLLYKVRQVTEFFTPRFLWVFFLSIIVGIALSLVEVAFAYGLQSFLVVVGIAQLNNIQVLKWIPSHNLLNVTLFLCVISVCRGCLHWSQEYLRGSAYELFRYIQSARLVRWAFESTSANSAYVTYLLNTRINFAADGIMNLQQTLLLGPMSLFLFFWMLCISLKMTVFTCFFGLLMFPAIRFINKNSQEIGKSLATTAEKVNGRLLTSIRNLLLLRIYNLQKQEEQVSQEALSCYLDHSRKFYNFGAVTIAIPQVFGTILICSITWYMARQGGIAGGVMLSFFYLFFRFSQNTTTLVTAVAKVFLRWNELKQLYYWWDKNGRILTNQTKSSFLLKSNVTKKPYARINSPIGWKMNQISFKFPETTEYIFDDFSLNIPQGSAVIVTGTSGSGKSSLINLLVGELKPIKGDVRVQMDGCDMPLHKSLPSLLENIGYVGPESFLFDGSIIENISYGLNRTPSNKEIEQALENAECQFVFEVPKGIHHRITEQGQGLSAGQKQRLALARALLRKPKALILDEATANLDLDTENRVINTLAFFKGTVTLIMATHRHGLLKLADQHIKLG